MPARARNVTHYQMAVETHPAPLLPQLEQTASRQRQAEIAAWNAQSPVLKRGIAITRSSSASVHGHAVQTRLGALVHVYRRRQRAGEPRRHRNGPGPCTPRWPQIVADELGVPLPSVLVTASDTAKVLSAPAPPPPKQRHRPEPAPPSLQPTERARNLAFVCGLDGCGAGEVRFVGGQVTSQKPCAVQRNGEAAYASPSGCGATAFIATPKIH